jgi:hypothetical protein
LSQETALEETNGRIQELHELSFLMLEEKNKGAETVPMQEYEELLDHYIKYIQDMRDGILEYGDKVYCSKCAEEMKGGD